MFAVPYYTAVAQNRTEETHNVLHFFSLMARLPTFLMKTHPLLPKPPQVRTKPKVFSPFPNLF